MWQQLINDDEARRLDALIEKMETRVHRGNALQQILEAERCAAERVTTEPELEHEHD